jgi:hypothetical protein
LVGLKANMLRLRARDRIERGETAELDYQGIYDLYLLAYEDEAIARRARTDYLKNFVKASCAAAQTK